MQKTTHEKVDAEIRRLFAELGEIYAHAAETVPAPDRLSYMDGRTRLGEDRAKASDVILRIKKLQQL